MRIDDTIRAARLAALCLLGGIAVLPSQGANQAGEYAVVKQGLAPNRQFSIAGHSAGDQLYDRDSLYLLAEPGHRKIGPLEEARIGLNTSYESYRALWSTDSRHVAAVYNDSHTATFVLYRIEHRRAFPVAGPVLWEQITARIPGARAAGADPRRAFRELTWLSPTRFRLTEQRYYEADKPDLGRSLGRFGKAVRSEETIPGTAYAIQFSAEAICELVAGDRYRIVSLKPGAFD